MALWCRIRLHLAAPGCLLDTEASYDEALHYEVLLVQVLNWTGIHLL